MSFGIAGSLRGGRGVANFAFLTTAAFFTPHPISPPGKPGEAQTFEAQWARSRPISDFRPDSPGAGGMSPAAPRHIPVLGREAVEIWSPRDGGIYVDATFGAGGYSRAILDTAGTRVIGIDRDRSAIAGGFDLVDQSAGRLTLVEDRFSNLADVCAAQGSRRSMAS